MHGTTNPKFMNVKLVGASRDQYALKGLCMQNVHIDIRLAVAMFSHLLKWNHNACELAT